MISGPDKNKWRRTMKMMKMMKMKQKKRRKKKEAKIVPNDIVHDKTRDKGVKRFFLVGRR